jgi:hypothetical protein
LLASPPELQHTEARLLLDVLALASRTGTPRPVQWLPKTISRATSLLVTTGNLALPSGLGFFLAVMG